MIGKTLSGYQIISEVAEGGMGLVYKGISEQNSDPVAIKVLREEIGNNRDAVGRFIQEAVIYKKILHPNLVEFLTFGYSNQVGFFLVTEFLEGYELEDYIRSVGVRKALSPNVAMDLSLQICSGLSAAHEAGIVHRDLKPANVFLIQQPQERQHTKFLAKIFDFGIGYFTESERKRELFEESFPLGTPLYMAPEQIRLDMDQLGPTCDIYALGVMMFQMFTGNLPFVGSTPKEVLKAHLTKKPPLLRKFSRSFSGTSLESLVAQMLEKDPLDRPQHIEDVIEKLWAYQQESQQSKKTFMEFPTFQEERSSLPDSTMDEQTQTNQVLGALSLKQEGKYKDVGWFILGEKLKIGAHLGASIRLRERGVQNFHAELSCSLDGILTVHSLTDFLVRVNGAEVQSMVLKNHDWLTIGDAELKVELF